MAMEKITGAPLLRQSILDSTRTGERSGKKIKGEESRADLSSTTTGDKAEISETAHRLMELRQAVDTGRTSLLALPEVREQKLAAARERLESGFYQTAAVREKVAAGVLSTIVGMEEL